MASPEMQKYGQAQLDAFNTNIAAILNALSAAKIRALTEGGTFAELVDGGLAAAKELDNTAPPACLHCHLEKAVSVWAAYHMEGELQKIKDQGWRPGEPGQLPETLIRACISIAGLGQLAGEVAKEADDRLNASGSVLANLLTRMIQAFGYGSDTLVNAEVVQLHPGSTSKH